MSKSASDHSDRRRKKQFSIGGRWLFCTSALLLLIGTLGSRAASSPHSTQPKPSIQQFDSASAPMTHYSHDDGHTHVLVINLDDPHIRFETVLSGYEVPGTDQFVECTDVNIPEWALPGRGCQVPGTELYPVETVEQMVDRYRSYGVTAAVNADYFGHEDRKHGPEGLTVKNGERFDGWQVGDCDNNPKDEQGRCYGNDVNRSSLSISRLNQVEIGRKQSQDLDEPMLLRTRFFNAVGGGPLIVKEKKPIANDIACPSEGFPISRCSRTKQTAVGVTQDGHFLVLAWSDQRNAYQIAQLVSEHHHVRTAMKFDGGGSAQMWFREGKAETYKYVPDPKKPRSVAEALIVFSSQVPRHDSYIIQQPNFPVLQPGEKAVVSFGLQNTGFLPWEPTLGYHLENMNNQTLGTSYQQGLTKPVLARDTYPFQFEVTAPERPGVYESKWRMVYDGEDFGEELLFAVSVVPKGEVKLADTIKRLIAEAQEVGRDWVNERWEDLKSTIEERIRKTQQTILEKILEWIANLINDFINQLCSTCGAPAAFFALTVFLLLPRKA